MVTQSPGFPFAHVHCGLLSDSQATETRPDCRARRPRPAAGGGPVRNRLTPSLSHNSNRYSLRVGLTLYHSTQPVHPSCRCRPLVHNRLRTCFPMLFV
jgi:hypothetical protein